MSLADVSHQYSREALGQGAPKESRARDFYTSRLTVLSDVKCSLAGCTKQADSAWLKLFELCVIQVYM